MKKLLFYIFVVLLGVGAIDAFVSFVVEKSINKVYKSTLSGTYGAESEIVIVGASRAIHHYIPYVIKDSLDLSAYVYGTGGQNIYSHYVIIRSLIEHARTKPQLVLLELSYIDVNNTPKWNTEKLNVLFPLYYSENAVKNVLDDVLDNKELCVVKSSGLYRHNSKFLQYLKNGILDEINETPDGYIPLKNSWGREIKSEMRAGDINEVDSTKISYIKMIIDLCKQKNVILAFSISPNYSKSTNEIWKEEVERIANKYNIKLLDHYQDSVFLMHSEWFNEPFHLNETGAEIYTKMIVKDIKILLNNSSRYTFVEH